MKKFLLFLSLILCAIPPLKADVETIFFYNKANDSKIASYSNLHAYMYKDGSPSNGSFVDDKNAMTQIGVNMWAYSSLEYTSSNGYNLIFNNGKSSGNNQTMNITTFGDGYAFTTYYYWQNSSNDYNTSAVGSSSDKVKAVLRTWIDGTSTSAEITLNYVGNGVFKSDAAYINNGYSYGISMRVDGTQYGWLHNTSDALSISGVTVQYDDIDTNGSVSLASGYYTFTLDLSDTSNITLKAEPLNIYLPGKYNGWNRTNDSAKFKYNAENGSYYIYVDDLSNTSNFVTDSDGKTVEEGYKVYIKDNGAWLRNGSDSDDLTKQISLVSGDGSNIPTKDLTSVKAVLTNVTLSSATLTFEEYSPKNVFTVKVGNASYNLTERKDGTYKTTLVKSVDANSSAVVERVNKDTEHNINVSQTLSTTTQTIASTLSDVVFTLTYKNDRDATLSIEKITPWLGRKAKSKESVKSARRADSSEETSTETSDESSVESSTDSYEAVTALTYDETSGKYTASNVTLETGYDYKIGTLSDTNNKTVTFDEGVNVGLSKVETNTTLDTSNNTLSLSGLVNDADSQPFSVSTTVTTSLTTASVTDTTIDVTGDITESTDNDNVKIITSYFGDYNIANLDKAGSLQFAAELTDNDKLAHTYYDYYTYTFNLYKDGVTEAVATQTGTQPYIQWTPSNTTEDVNYTLKVSIKGKDESTTYKSSSTFKVYYDPENKDGFYLGNMEHTNESPYCGRLKVDANDTNNQEVIYSWAKFENYVFTNTKNEKSSYANTDIVKADNNTKDRIWAREYNSDNATVKSNDGTYHDAICFNPSYYRLYMYVVDKTSDNSESDEVTEDSESDKAAKVTELLNKRYEIGTVTDNDKQELVDAINDLYSDNDHGVQGKVIYGGTIVCRTSGIINFAGSTTSVADMIFGESEVDAPVEYYNLNGVKMNSEDLAPGLYIMRRGDKSAKVLIK